MEKALVGDRWRVFLTQRTYTSNSIPFIVYSIGQYMAWWKIPGTAAPPKFVQQVTYLLASWNIQCLMIREWQTWELFCFSDAPCITLCLVPNGESLWAASWLWRSHDADTIHWYALCVLLEMAKNPQSESESLNFVTIFSLLVKSWKRYRFLWFHVFGHR